MLTVKAKFDGKHLTLAENVEVTREEEVIVVFLNRNNLSESEVSGNQIQSMVMDSGSLSFLKLDQEDVYSDKDLKVKY
jgi:hypothetical protein